jgi:hypothetical protein
MLLLLSTSLLPLLLLLTTTLPRLLLLGRLLLLRGGARLLLGRSLLLLTMSGVGTLAFNRREFVCALVGGPTLAFVLLDDCSSNVGKREASGKVCALKI